MLREEMVNKMNKQDQLTQFTYTTSMAIWSIALTVDNEWLIMVSLLILIPISLRSVKFRMDCAFLGAYMSVFLEKDISIKWESNNKIYYNRYPRGKKQNILYWFSKFDYIFIAIISSILFWLMRIDDFIIINEKFTALLIVFQIVIIIIEGIIVKQFSDFAKHKEKYYKKWEKLYFESFIPVEKSGENSEE